MLNIRDTYNTLLELSDFIYNKIISDTFSNPQDDNNSKLVKPSLMKNSYIDNI